MTEVSQPMTSADIGAVVSATARRIAGSRAIRTAVAAAIGLAPFVAGAVPVLPGAMGYGVSTPAGRGGTVYRVTSLAETGSGTLKACIDASGPRVCVFEVSGTIRLTDDLQIRNPKITIAGQTAPSPGIMLRGGALSIHASDVLVQHLHVRAGDDPVGFDPVNRDALKIEQAKDKPIITNIVIDHCSFSWAIDEVASAWSGWNNITLMNNIFAEPLNDSIHPKGPHGYGVIFGPVDGNVTMANNLLMHAVSRNPLTNVTHAVFINNVIYNWKNMAIDLQSRGLPTQNSVVGNVFIRGHDSTDQAPISLRADETALPAGSKVFVSDNKSSEVTSDPWSATRQLGGTLPMSSIKSELPVGWPAGMTTLPTSEDVVLKNVLKNVGARPADRDSVDKRLVNQVQTRTGQIINCVSPNGTARCNLNAGGWPQMAENRRALTLPANPNGVGEGGYTNLEVWLQNMAAQVEGRSSRLPEAPVLSNR
jgi:hypothetical protein